MSSELQLYYKRLQHRFFSSEICKIFRTPCFTDQRHLQRLLLPVYVFQPVTLLKRRLRQRCFSVKFTKYLRTSFARTPPDECSQCLSDNFEKFFKTPLSQSTLFHVQFAEFHPPDTLRNYFTSAFQVFYTRMASSHSITLKP